jgi:AcrR family transcriptional regulator
MPRPTPSATAAGTAPLRRAPSQRRSRERVERLLAAASALIAARGSEAMRMSDVAAGAGVPIGSLYQYFPDKGAIIRTLAERYNARGHACIEAELATVRSAAGLRAALARLTDAYYALFLAEPVMRDIWSGTQADKALQAIDVADIRANAALLQTALERLRPRADRARLAISALLTMQLIAATVRLAISLERGEGDALIAAFKRMLPKGIASVE